MPSSRPEGFYPSQPSGRPRVAVVATGGTIANTPNGRVPISHVLADIETRYPDERLQERFALETIEVERDGAERFTPATWVRIRDAVQEASDRADVDGVVVTHGTYTVEETAYYLHLTVDTTKPLVITCSQRKHGTVGNDGDRNLVDALRAAAEPDLTGEGAVLVAHEEIHSAREVLKTSRRPGGFSSPALGPLGFADADRIALYRSQRRRHTSRSAFARQSAGSLPDVEIVTTYPGAPAQAVRAVADRDARGLVVQGFAYAGKPYHAQVDALLEVAASGLPVVYVSRGREGRIPLEGTTDPFVRADNLAVSKAHVLATTAIAAGYTDPDRLQEVFDEH